jgi:AcrR family transcriptional regulator
MEMQPRGRKRELRGNVRQRRLVTALVELLSEGKRFNDILIQDIAKRAGITRGAFYYFFQSKEEVLIAASNDLVTQVVDATNSFLQGSGEDFRRELHDALHQLARLRFDLQPLTRALSDAAAEDRSVWSALESKFESVIPRIAERLLQVRSQIERDITPHAAQEIARALAWGNERNFYRLSVRPSTLADWDNLAEVLYAIWLAAFVGAM